MNSTLSRISGHAAPAATGMRGLVSDYCDLTKPRIVLLLLITTVAAMIMAAHGIPPLGLAIATLVGGGLAAGSAGAFNCVFDRDIDRLMRRTAARPLPAGRIRASHALVFAASLGAVGFGVLYIAANPLAAWLSLAGNIYYVVIYTMWLKRTTTLNIVIGGVAGAVPPLVGWAAVTHAIGAPALGMFALIFLWTPPHFWALALMAETDYQRANVPMLPTVRGAERTKVEIFSYAVIMVLVSLVLTPFGIMGLWYFVPATLLGSVFILDAWKLLRGPTKPLARVLFKYSLLYLALMCAAMVLDRVVAG